MYLWCRYCQRLNSANFWGGEVELLVLSKMLHTPIYVYKTAQEGGRYALSPTLCVTVDTSLVKISMLNVGLLMSHDKLQKSLMSSCAHILTGPASVQVKVTLHNHACLQCDSKRSQLSISSVSVARCRSDGGVIPIQRWA